MHDNTLLFLRTGLNPSSLQMLANLIEGKAPSIRACQHWFNGEKVTKNGIIKLAHKLDEMMSDYALQILHEEKQKNQTKIWIVGFDDDDELWRNHQDMIGISNTIHSALINRIITIGMTLEIEVLVVRGESDSDWGSTYNVAIDKRILFN